MPRIALLTAATLAAAALSAPTSRAADPPGGAAPCPDAEVVPAAGAAPTAAEAIRCLIAQERAARGLRALHDEPHLRRAARAAATALAAARSPRSSPSATRRRIVAAGYQRGRGFAFAEVHGVGAPRASTPAARVRGWLRSAPTRRLLLSTRFTDAAVAVRTAHGRTVYVLELAAPAKASSR